jgi:hypothetical protein
MNETKKPKIDENRPRDAVRPRGAHTVPFARPTGSLTICLLILLPVIAFLQSCERPSPVEKEKKRTLTEDERYIVQLYMKITEIEENLQDNPDARDEKYGELRREFDPARIRRILLELEQNPDRWLAIYGRINELLERRERTPST